jgi:ubiquinone/menaquinone biosynthesis C-methylase UbiE
LVAYREPTGVGRPSKPAKLSARRCMTDSDRGYWDKLAKNYDRSMSLLGRPIPRMVELAGEATRGLRRVLEVAAGTGLVTPALAAGSGEVVATDYSLEMVTALDRRVRDAGAANVRCEQADLYTLRFDDGTFDAVVAANVLHLVPDLPAALAALRRVVKPGGKVVVPTFCHDETGHSWVVSRALAVTGFPGHRRFTAKSLQQAIKDAGIRVNRTETVPGLIPIAYVEGTN